MSLRHFLLGHLLAHNCFHHSVFPYFRVSTCTWYSTVQVQVQASSILRIFNCQRPCVYMHCHDRWIHPTNMYAYIHTWSSMGVPGIHVLVLLTIVGTILEEKGTLVHGIPY